MVLDQARVHLSAPLEPTLRGAVDEDDRATPWVSSFHDVELDAPASCDSMTFHHVPPLLILLPSHACAIAGRNLKREERLRYTGDATTRETCQIATVPH